MSADLVKRGFVLFCSLLITSCASISGFPDRTGSVEVQLRDLRSKYFEPGAAKPGGKIAAYNAATSPAKRKKLRNEIVYNRLLAYDLQFSIFQEALYKEGIVSNLSLDILGLGLGSAGGVVTDATTSRILSALSGGISGSRASINKNLYFEKTLPALLSLMIASRETIKAQIYQGLEQDDATYPLGRAFADLERYYLAGSIPGAIAAVTEVAGKTKQAADIKIDQIRAKSFVDVAVQNRVSKLLDAVTDLPDGKALIILKDPPVKLTSGINAMMTASLGGKALKDISDDQAKMLLKRIVVMAGRKDEELKAWEAAIRAK